MKLFGNFCKEVLKLFLVYTLEVNNLDCNYALPIDSAPNEITFGTKSMARLSMKITAAAVDTSIA